MVHPSSHLLRSPNHRQRAQEKKEVLFPVLASGLSAFLSLFAAELLTRQLEYRRQEEMRKPPEALDLLQLNPRGTGPYRLKPNLDLSTRVGGYEVRIKTNRHGMRWREVDHGSSDKKRVAFFGDSFTFGCWADSVEKSFVGVFERNVPPNEFETLNFGVGGYGLADVELQIREQGLQFSPSYAILVFYNGNDFRDTYLGTEKDDIVNGTTVLISGRTFDINFPQAYVRTFATEKNIPFLDLSPLLRSHVQRTNENLFVPGDTHFNNKGHRLVGIHLADWFECCVRR
jgi:lysophospholipase L1-like esterase